MATISTAAFYERANLQLSSLRKRAETLQGQVSSGQRLTRSSEDPVAAAKLRSLSRQETLRNVDQTNSDRANTDLNLADKSIGSIANIVIRAKELAIQANNSTVSDSNRDIIATEIDNLHDNLFSLINTRDAAGNSLFGGETAGNAYDDVGGIISYVGSADAPVAELGDDQSVQRSVTGPEVLDFNGSAGATNLFAVLSAFSASLSTGGPGALAGSTEAMGQLDASLEKITTQQTIIGTRQAWVETIDDRRVDTGELLSQEQATLGGADLAETITRLQEVSTVLEASQGTFVRLSGLSLFNQLR